MDAMFFLGFLVATIIVYMEILASRAQGFVASVVTDESQVDLLIGHMRACGILPCQGIEFLQSSLYGFRGTCFVGIKSRKL